ncbi:hypothetical protein [Microbacterium stercoris]|uniref:Uncharacterized protein n=1 Tax=Microbacterium stercoris TaxID=2820289 RepID=A0A939QL36_9MICO|nr:hypothetical protein [Microbacterium stercoris]MBO3664894.1 hypothetical protein [Microbacterium stercoris]
MTLPDGPQTEAVLKTLLIDAATAHGRYEAEELGGVYDDDWPSWYAAHMAQALRDADREIRGRS